MTFKKSLLFFTTSLSLCSGAGAILPFNAAMGVTKHFQDSHASPTFGLIGLNTDIVKNIRFGFVESFVCDKEGRRTFVSDKGSNPHWCVAKILFPSANGVLGIDTMGRDNFSTHATLETMATLMMYVAEVRQFLRETNMNKALRLSKMNAAALFKQPGLKALKEHYQDRLKAPAASKSYEKDTLIPLFYNLTKALLAEKMGEGPFPQGTTEQLMSSFVCMKADTRDDIKNVYLKTLAELDQRGRVLHPRAHTPSDERFQDITSFEEGDVQKFIDIEALKIEQASTAPSPSSSAPASSAASSSAASSSAASSSAASSSAASSSAASSDEHPCLPELDVDALYGVFVLPFFKETIPYMGNPPSHGPANSVFGPDAIISPANYFSDCNENSLRTLLNLLVYNAKMQKFDLSFLNGLKGPRINLLWEFYGLQPKELAGAISQDIRTAWNRVVGDLNSLEEDAGIAASSSGTHNSLNTHHVRYLKDRNELDSGFANVLRVFEKILGKEFLPMFPENDIHDQEQAIRQGFSSLFSLIAPNKKITFDFSDLSQKENDLAGNLTIKVGNDFQFTLVEGSFTHGHVDGLTSLTPKGQNEERRLDVMRANKNKLSHGILESMLLLDPQMANQARNPYYQLISQKLLGNEEALSFLKKLNALETQQDFTPLLEYVAPLLEYVLSHIAWDDGFTQRLILDEITPFLSKEKYKNTLRNNVKYFETTNQYPLTFALETFPYLAHLIVSREDVVAFDRPMKHLRSLELEEATHITGLENLPALGHMMVTTPGHSLTWDSPALNLQSLNLIGALKSLPDLSRFPSLEHLTLSRTAITSVHIRSPLQKLTYLSLPVTLTSLTGIGNLPALTSLYLTGNQMTSLYIDGPVPGVTNLSLPCVATHFDGLEHLPSLCRMLVASDTLTLRGKKDDWHIHPFYEFFNYKDTERRIFAQNPSGITWEEED